MPTRQLNAPAVETLSDPELYAELARVVLDDRITRGRLVRLGEWTEGEHYEVSVARERLHRRCELLRDRHRQLDEERSIRVWRTVDAAAAARELAEGRGRPGLVTNWPHLRRAV